MTPKRGKSVKTKCRKILQSTYRDKSSLWETKTSITYEIWF